MRVKCAGVTVIGVGWSPRSTARAMGPTISAEELVHRARERCKHHRQPGVGGVCRNCVLIEIEQAIADEHPEMKRGDVFELVQEWFRTDPDSQH